VDDKIYSPSVELPQSADQQFPGVEHPKSIGSHIVDFIQTLVVFAAIFAIIYLFIAQPHKVSGNSMLPNFQNGNYILTDKISYRFSLPKYTDVVVLKDPLDPSKDFIKRVIAVPGDTVMVKGNLVYVNGNLLDERYLPSDRPTTAGAFLHEGEEITAGANQYFVFGDNREHSSDSREWGPVTKEGIIGKVIIRYWPPSAGIGLIQVPNLRP
jgi:signal peptidase I